MTEQHLKEALRRVGIPLLLKENIERAVLIYGAPQHSATFRKLKGKRR